MKLLSIAKNLSLSWLVSNILHVAVFTSVASTEARQILDRFVDRGNLDNLLKISSLTNRQNLSVTGSTLAPFMIERVPGTEGNQKVHDFIIQTFQALKWHIEEDVFSDTTPYGPMTFKNIIVTKNPSAPRRLTLAAHFDSKIFPGQRFIGATDSAVPCAILIDIAKTLNTKLERHQEAGGILTTLQFIFFDGEEAFKTWTDTDSIYGARHLAAKWAKQVTIIKRDPFSVGTGPGASTDASQIVTNPIKQMDVMILLDLLGTAGASIPAMHANTMWAWDRLVDIEHRLAENSLLSEELQNRIYGFEGSGIFKPGLASHLGPTAIADDHLPFYRLGVPIVHCIPVPFPAVWHTINDDAPAIDHDTVVDLALIFRVFVTEYLGLYHY